MGGADARRTLGGGDRRTASSAGARALRTPVGLCDHGSLSLPVAPRRFRVALAFAAAALAWPAAAGARAPERILAVAAAASLRPALDELERRFEAANPGVDVRVSAGASGGFVAQLRNGAPFDLFLSADREYPAAVIAAGLARPEDEVIYAIGRLALWVPAGSPLDIEGRGLASVADPRLRKLAIPNPAAAPYGRAAEAALRSAGVLEAVRDRLVLGQNAAQAALFADTGAADAALLPVSLTLLPGLRDGRVLELPAGMFPRLEQSGVVLSAARDPALARAFLSYLRGPEGRAALARLGYGLP
jgi:molybdate transport system substrate-binding protein